MKTIRRQVDMVPIDIVRFNATRAICTTLRSPSKWVGWAVAVEGRVGSRIYVGWAGDQESEGGTN